MTQLTCPRCDEPLGLNQEWQLVNWARLGTVVEADENIQGDYAHRECVI